MSESATAFAEEIKTLGEKIVGLTLKQAKELSDYLKEVHGIEAASGGAVMMAAPSDAAAAGADRCARAPSRRAPLALRPAARCPASHAAATGTRIGSHRRSSADMS